VVVLRLEYPFTAAKVRELKLGREVLVSGPVHTARDAVHRYLFEGGKPPGDLADGAIYHCGPIVLGREGAWLVRAAGPTTSMRQEPFTPELIRRCRVRVIIGKGGMGDGTRLACAEHGCVYLHAVGGAAALMARCVTRVDGVHFMREFGPAEAMWHLVVKDMPAVVTIDARGRSLHRRVRSASARALDAIVRDGPLT